MPIRPCPAVSESPARPSGAGWLLPRRDAVIVMTDEREREIRLDNGTSTSRRTYRLRPGHSLLIASADRPTRIAGNGLQLRALPNDVSRLLAFHDHGRGINRDIPPDRSLHATLRVVADLGDDAVVHHWLIKQLLVDAPAFRELAALLARREAYQLVRFVLDHPGHGVQQLADRYGLSVAQFRRIGRKAFGRSIKEQLRLLRAGRVLHCYADTGRSFTRLSSDFGFSSPSHFCSEIKSLLGSAPRAIFQSVQQS